MALVGPQLHNLQDHMENQIRTFFSGGWFPKVSSSRDGKCMYSVALLLKLVAQAHLQVISGVLKVVRILSMAPYHLTPFEVGQVKAHMEHGLGCAQMCVWGLCCFAFLW